MGYHLTKSNPEKFNLQDCLDDIYSFDCWTTGKKSKPDDVLFIGLSGKDAGIYIKAVITSKPIFQKPDGDGWTGPKEELRERWMAKVHFPEKPIEPPILEKELESNPKLIKIADWLHMQGAVRYLSDEEGKALEDMIKLRAEKS